MSAARDDAARWAAELRLVQDEPRFDRYDTSWEHDNPDQMGVPLTWADDYPAIKAPETVIDGLLERSTVAVCFGEPNTGKSTFVLNMALAVARGAPWRGRRTRKGIVVWLALESSAGLRRRVAAYRQHHGLTGESGLLFGDITQALRLLDAGDVQALVTTIRT